MAEIGKNKVILRSQTTPIPEEHIYIYPVPEEVRQEIASQLVEKYGEEWSIDIEHIVIKLTKERREWL